ncbi:hypothetical protein GSD1FS_1827 [Bifidobacterium sp. GSD1FS]|uniref:Uncharacterized protein n=1 Tax=Bifidobacterium canis TaxID=2610880 RepID=A0A7K1J708_9BIFI|nr:hypothetical protein [Bifidobacterium canis]
MEKSYCDELSGNVEFFVADIEMKRATDVW